jgi:Tfp pilus assembly protein PilN
MIKVNLLKDHSIPVDRKLPDEIRPKIPWFGYAYIVAVILAVVMLGYLWNVSGKAIIEATAENQRLEKDLKIMEDLRKQFVELERKKQERQGRVDIIEKLLESQKGPVKLLNAVIQAIPQDREFWLTSLEQTNTGVKVKGETKVQETLPDFMENLKKSGIFASVDVEQIERRDESYNFSIICAGGK